MVLKKDGMVLGIWYGTKHDMVLGIWYGTKHGTVFSMALRTKLYTNNLITIKLLLVYGLVLSIVWY
jgi:hypothetical protein